MKGKIKMNTQKTNHSGYEVSEQGHVKVRYFYKEKKQKRSKSTVYFIQTNEVTGFNTETESNYVSQNRFMLQQNQLDNSRTYVVIKFYLPKSTEAKLILMDSEKSEAMYLLNEELQAGNHTLITGIRNEELNRFSYYYKLEADGYSEVRQMKYVSFR